MFSQTGGEIVEICKSLGRWPDYIITNRGEFSDSSDINQELRNQIDTNTKLISIPKWPTIVDYMKISDCMGYSILNERWKEDILVTLHGYLRILPEEFCDKTKIFNGHPGLITKYPELKGFNPQAKAWKSKEKYPKVGCVLHRVIPELDSGEVIAEAEIDNNFESLDDLTGGLHELSIQLWKDFLKDKL